MDASLLTVQRLIAHHSTSEGGQVRAISNVRLIKASAPMIPVAEMTEPRFARVARGAKYVSLGERVFDYGVGRYLVSVIGCWRYVNKAAPTHQTWVWVSP
jgi:AraC-type transcriptional regulator